MDKRTPPPAPGTDSTTAGAAKPTDDAESPVAKPAARAPRARASASTRTRSRARRRPVTWRRRTRRAAWKPTTSPRPASSAIEQKKVALRDIIAHATVGDTASLAKTLEAIMTGSSPDDAQACARRCSARKSRRRPKPRPAPTTNWRPAGATPIRIPTAT
jgi:hypothetical protein